jgi:hypothetical protein
VVSPTPDADAVRDRRDRQHLAPPMNRTIKLLYGFSFFCPFMIVIPVWVPDLATHGIRMRQFMKLQAFLAIVAGRRGSPGQRPR